MCHKFLFKFALIASVMALTMYACFEATASAEAVIRYAQPDGATIGICDTWANACDLQYTLTTAVSGTEIWVARGVYTPGLPLINTFQIKSGVALYGGFSMTETARDQRNWQTNITVLSGDIDNNDSTDANGVVTSTANIHGVNAQHVTDASNTDDTAVLDGFTITAGNDACSTITWPPWCRGGGMYADHGSPTLTHVIFSGNQAPEHFVPFDTIRPGVGGGLYTNYGNPTLTNVIFTGNSGGGMFNSYGNPTLSDVTFRNNVAEAGGGMCNISGTLTLTSVIFESNSGGGGGGVYNYEGSLTLTNVVFRGNQALASGGGLYSESSRNSRLTNVVFSGNLASQGGGMYIKSGDPILTNVTFSGNRLECDMCTTIGAGIYVVNSRPTLVNCILWGNFPDELHADSGSIPTIIYSDIYSSTGVYAGVGNLNTNPQFVASVAAPQAPTTAGDYRLLPTSPAIDAGNNFSVTFGIDLDGRPRHVDIPIVPDTGHGSAPIVDMGAYENQLYRAFFLPMTIK